MQAGPVTGGGGGASAAGNSQPQLQPQVGMYAPQASYSYAPQQQVHRYRHSTGGVGSTGGTGATHLGGQNYDHHHHDHHHQLLQHRRPGDTRVPTPYLPPPPPLDLKSPILVPVKVGGVGW
jgi:hypothetical protein